MSMTLSDHPTTASWASEISPEEARARQNFAAALLFSLLIHLGLLFLFKSGIIPTGEQTTDPNPPLSVTIANPKPTVEPKAVEAPAVEKPTPRPTQKRHIIALSSPNAHSRAMAVEPEPTPPSVPEPVAVPENAAPVDMMSMVQASRARRQRGDLAAAAENAAAVAREAGPSENEIAMANINRNLKRSVGKFGTSGVFQITSMGTRIGAFTFRGWTDDPRDSTHESFEVDAGLNGNLQLAMVRRMIELIRTHYDGDFKWESWKTDRIYTLSARLDRNAELEAFMMEEFFGSQK